LKGTRLPAVPFTDLQPQARMERLPIAGMKLEIVKEPAFCSLL